MELGAEQVVNEYLGRMNDWEVVSMQRFNRMLDFEEEYDQVKIDCMREYMDIFHAFCASVATPRSFSCSDPPEFEKQAPLISAVYEAEEAIVRVASTRYGVQYWEFALVPEESEWKILNRTMVMESGVRIAAAL